MRRLPLMILLILNSIVLLGQLWPEGAPPFARIVNIIFLAATFTLFAWMLARNKNRA